MGSTPMLTGNSLTRKVWEKKIWVQAVARTAFGHIFNRGAVYFPEELLGKSAVGDNVTFSYVGKLTGKPQGEGGTLDGNEEALSLNSHNMSMNVSRLGVLNPNRETVEQTRTYVKFDENSKEALTNRTAELLDTSTFYQLAGAAPSSLTIDGTTYSTAAELLHVQGHNTPVAPSTNRYLNANGTSSNDENITSSDIMSLDLLDYALEKNDRADQPIEAFDDQTLDCFMSPEQIVDLQQNSASKIQWFNIELAKITGGYKDNEIENRFKNKLVCAGRYRNINLYSAKRVAFGVNSSTAAGITTVRRAVLIGKDALSFASPFGGRVTDKDVPVRFKEMLKDYEYYKGMEARLLYGLKKMSPSNKDDIGVMVLSTYAAAHA